MKFKELFYKRKGKELKSDGFEKLLITSVKDVKDKEFFGYASESKTLNEAISIIKSVNGYDAEKMATAYAMYLSAFQFKTGDYRDDVLLALDQLARTKFKIDQSVCHTCPVVEITSEILLAAQRFADNETIGCNEWPSVQEITNFVLSEAKKLNQVQEWRVTQYDNNGLVSGIETYVS